jgi:hypothetical protein
LVLEARLPPEAGAVVEKAIEAALEELRGEQQAEAPSAEPEVPSPEPAMSLSQARADALARVAERSLGAGEGSRSHDRFQVVVHVDAEKLANPEAAGRCELENGPGLSAESLRRLTCDGSLVAMLHDEDGKVLNVGRKTRVIPTALRRAMGERDQGCCFPGCNARSTQGHHVEHWADGGETKLDNLVSMCKRHHRLVHEGGVRLRLDDARQPVFSRPDGAEIHGQPAAPTLRADPVETVTLWNRAAGLLIDATTNLPDWDGEIPQYDYIAAVMADLAESRQSAAA